MTSDDVYYRDSRRVPWAKRLSWQARNRVCDLFFAIMQPTASTRVLDLGVSEEDTSFEANMLERRYPWPDNLTCAGIHEGTVFRRVYPSLSYVRIIRGEPLPFPDLAFDVAYSNAVIEHVGGPDQQRTFLRELVRVATRVFVIAPNRWFPIEHHTGLPFVHWLPDRWFRGLLRQTRLRYWAREENLVLMTGRTLARQFPPGTRPVVRHVGIGAGIWRSNVVAYT